MPSFKNLFLNLISIALPLAVSAYVFNELVSSQTEMQNKMNRVLSSYSTNTAPENKINETKVLEKLVKSMLKVSESGKSIFFDKLVLTGTDKPASFKLEDDQGFIWMNSGKTRIFLSASGRDRVEIVTDRFFNRDLTLRRDLDVLKDLEVSGIGIFRGGMNIDGNIDADTITLSSAYITESLNVSNNLSANSLTIATAYITEDMEVIGNLTSSFISAPYANLSNLNISNFSGTSGFMTNFGVTSNFSAATATFTNLTLANALPVIYGGSGLTNAPALGQILIGNGTGYNLNYLSAGSNITINTGAGTITINAVAGGTNANNYVNAISFSDASPTLKTLLLSREGISSLAASFSISSADITSALGYTPLRNSSDNITGNLGIFGSFSAATAQFPNLFANVFSASTANLTDLYSSRFSAANVGITTALSAANASFTTLNAGSFSGTSGFLTNFGVISNFSAANVGITTLLSVPTGNFTSRLGVAGDFSAANIGVTTNLSAAIGNFTTRLGVNGDFSAANVGITTLLSVPTGNFTTRLGVNGAFSASGNSRITGSFAASTISTNMINLDPENQYAQQGNNISNQGGITLNVVSGALNINLENGFNISNRSSMAAIQIGDYGYAESVIEMNGLYTRIGLGDFLARIQTTNIGGNYDNLDIWNGRGDVSIGLYSIAAYTLPTFNIKDSLDKNVFSVNFKTIAFSTPLIVMRTNTKPQIIIGSANRNIATESTSDLRFKSGVSNIENALAEIAKLRGVYYNWRVSPESEETLPHREFGLIAQEVEKLYPELVDRNGDGFYTLDYAKFTALLIEGVKEQKIQIEELSLAIKSINLTQMQTLYDSLNSSLENLSISTENGALVVNTNLTVTGKALFNNATFTGNVEVGQVKIDSLENDISIKAASCVDMDGNLNQESCDSNKLNLMQNKAGNVEMFDGQVKFKPNGEVLGEKVQAKTFKNTPSSAPGAGDSCNAGEFKFAEDNGKVYVFFCSESVGWVRSELSKY